MVGVRQWLTKKVSSVVQDAVVEPAKKDVAAVRDDVGKKVNLVTNVIRFLMYAAIGTVILKEAGQEESKTNSGRRHEPTTIVINNYIHEGGQRHDSRKLNQSQKGGQPR